MVADSLAHRLPDSIWMAETRYDSSAVPEWTKWLSDEEKACLDSFGAAVRRREFLAGRAAARHLLGERLNAPPAAVPLRQADDGAVNVEKSEWHVSISHSAEHAVAVCARHSVGVDMEQIQARDEGVARFLLHPESRREGLLRSLPYDKNDALILCWTLKEAVLKARRSGFRKSPKTLRLEVDADCRRATVHVEGEGPWSALYEKGNDFILSVAHPRIR